MYFIATETRNPQAQAWNRRKIDLSQSYTGFQDFTDAYNAAKELAWVQDYNILDHKGLLPGQSDSLNSIPELSIGGIFPVTYLNSNRKRLIIIRRESLVAEHDGRIIELVRFEYGTIRAIVTPGIAWQVSDNYPSDSSDVYWIDTDDRFLRSAILSDVLLDVKSQYTDCKKCGLTCSGTRFMVHSEHNGDLIPTGYCIECTEFIK
jgi:hypothetical protein